MVAKGADTEARIAKVKLERQRLAKVRSKLEAQLGEAGRKLHKLDAALVAARKASNSVRKELSDTEDRLVDLENEKERLELHISVLRKQVLDESSAAWQQSSRVSEWASFLLSGVSASAVPHRQYLLNKVIESQEQDRLAYIASIKNLAQVEAALHEQQQQLELLHVEKKKVEQNLLTRVNDKRSMLKRVRKEISAKKRREQQLAHEEQALMRLLSSMSEGLQASDATASQKSIRKRKGRLNWPVSGKVVASFGSRPEAAMPRLKGVQLRPKSILRDVRAMGSGQVRYADWFGGFGLMLIVDYGDGILAVYAHNNLLYKKLGDWVEEGEVIAEAGSTGWINKVTLYFEVRDSGRAVDPKRWCRG